jgi:hypothetical protein
MISTMGLNMNGGKPFNPIIGETFQCQVGSTKIYYEQVCHHPPIFSYYGVNPNFKTFGFSAMEVQSGANSMQFENSGKFYLQFNDGVLHKFTPPQFTISGLTMGKRYMNFKGNMVVEDLVRMFIYILDK